MTRSVCDVWAQEMFEAEHNKEIQMQQDQEIKQAQDEFFRQHTALAQAAGRLYFAGVWKLEGNVIGNEEQKAMWMALRDALGLKPGTAMQLGIGG